jgi:hypothetical protein
MTVIAEDKVTKSCKKTETVTVHEEKEDINTPTPKELEDAVILVKRKDGKVVEMKASDFKVVPRKQQFKVRERTVLQQVKCEPTIIIEKAEEKKNLLALGIRRDYTDLSKSVNGNVGTLSSERAMVLDLSYMRQQLLGTDFGLGVGLDTNGTLRGILGYEF